MGRISLTFFCCFTFLVSSATCQDSLSRRWQEEICLKLCATNEENFKNCCTELLTYLNPEEDEKPVIYETRFGKRNTDKRNTMVIDEDQAQQISMKNNQKSKRSSANFYRYFRVGKKRSPQHPDFVRFDRSMMRLGKRSVPDPEDEAIFRVLRMGKRSSAFNDDIMRMGKKSSAFNDDMMRMGKRDPASNDDLMRMGKKSSAFNDDMMRMGKRNPAFDDDLMRMGKRYIYDNMTRMGKRNSAFSDNMMRMGKRDSAFNDDMMRMGKRGRNMAMIWKRTLDSLMRMG